VLTCHKRVRSSHLLLRDIATSHCLLPDPLHFKPFTVGRPSDDVRRSPLQHGMRSASFARRAILTGIFWCIRSAKFVLTCLEILCCTAGPPPCRHALDRGGHNLVPTPREGGLERFSQKTRVLRQNTSRVDLAADRFAARRGKVKDSIAPRSLSFENCLRACLRTTHDIT